MKKAFLLALVLVAPSMGASASGLRMTVEQPRFTCEGNASHFSRVAYVPSAPAQDLSDAAASDDAAPLPCCDGKIGCAQFLSTNTIIRQATQWHG